MSRAKLLTLTELLPVAQKHGFAVGSFSPRYPRMIAPILRAGEALQSPLIVQISHKDMKRCHVSIEPFAEAFFTAMHDLAITVPVTLHLDHTEDLAMIQAAIAVGFSSVMIDASNKPLQVNIALTQEVVSYSHERGVSVEGELGTIGAFGFSETEANDEATMTDPEQIEVFVTTTDIDALAVSVGTVHGVREGSAATIDMQHLARIRERTRLPLVLHGGSGVPADIMQRAIRLTKGGVSKVNLATDLELTMLKAMGSRKRVIDSQVEALTDDELYAAQAAIERIVQEKMITTLGSKAKTHHYSNIL